MAPPGRLKIALSDRVTIIFREGRMRHNILKNALVSMFALVVGVRGAQADDNANAYQAFLTTLSSMTTSANTVVQNQRNSGRSLKIRQALARKLTSELGAPETPVGAKDPVTGFLTEELSATDLLCKFRSAVVPIVPNLSERDPASKFNVDHLATLAAQNYLSSVVSQLKALTPPKATDVPGAISQLFNTYQVKAGAGSQTADDAKTRGDVEKVCEADLRDSERAYYGQEITFTHAAAPAAPPGAAAAAATGLPSLSFLGPIGSAFDVIAGIIGPVFIDFSNMEAVAKQKAAVKEFLDGNRAKLESQGEDFGRTLSYYLFYQRLSLAGQFAEQIASIKATSVDLKKIDACNVPMNEMAQRSDSGAPSAAFILCYRAVWSQYSKLVDDALSTANSYDQLADAGNTNAPLASYIKIFNNYNDVVEWSGGNNDIWTSVNQLITFAGAIANATSSSNLTAIKKALDAIK
jgi:hypothetical protein